MCLYCATICADAFNDCRKVECCLRKPFIRLAGATKTYHSGEWSVTALDAIDAQFGEGEFTVIIGKSGAGKSTLVNMISGVDNLSAGQLWVGNTAVHELSEDARSRWRGQRVGVVYQSFELLGQLSILDNVMLPMDFCGVIPLRERLPRAMQLLAHMDIAEHAGKTPDKISGGQKQRVAIARALANNPALILADEPTGNLDSMTSSVIYDLFRDLAGEGHTVVMVSHDRAVSDIADRVMELSDGRITADWYNEGVV